MTRLVVVVNVCWAPSLERHPLWSLTHRCHACWRPCPRAPLRSHTWDHTWLQHLLRCNLQHVDVVRAWHDSHDRVYLALPEALRLEEVLHIVQLEAHRTQLLHEPLSFLDEVGRYHSKTRSSRSHRELLLDQATLLRSFGVRLDLMLAHVVQQLAWNLIQYFFGEHVRIVLELIEWNELDDIGRHVLAVGLRVECLLITVEDLHSGEVCIADTDDDDGEG